jgi:DNA repair exonuclease SbcCD ATPase subunit
MPEFTIPTVDVNKAATDLTNALKEAAYVAVGLGVLGFQRAQVQRVELTKQLEEQLRNLPSPIDGYAQLAKEQAATARALVAEQLASLSKSVEEALAPVRDQLGLPDLSEQIETQWAGIRAQLTDLAKAVDERVAPARAQFDEQMDQFEGRLPEAARNLVHSVREAASTQEHALRSVVGLA